MILGRKKNTEVLYEGLLFICQNSSASSFLGFMLNAVSGAGWGMHTGEELLSQSSRQDADV